ncbi:helix-turn-helix domain-containing protein [Paenibacillus chitinolyticus]|uniref:helix-turn-helix domain-containing protein n=1 Tax=Paenibacillus chitinolyticus TaxID=79263 RepID=UPI00295EDBCF|nr:helix-turn-helix domain-containing protein [Paenibacillus chitinolyticus]
MRLKRVLLNRHSLVYKLFFSFLGILLLFSVFNGVSVYFFNKSMQNEIIQYNRLMLKNTAERYETHFGRIKTMLFDLYSNEAVVAFNRQLLTKAEPDIDYWKASEVLKTVRAQAYNPMFYLNNLLVYYDSHSLIVEKEGSVSAPMLFERFYRSADYPLAYWKEQFARSGNYMLHPQSSFNVTTLNSSVDVGLIPFSFRMPGSNYQIVALLDARALQEAFYGPGDSREFMILRDDGSLLYRSSSAFGAGDIPSFGPEGAGYAKAGDTYFFAEKDPLTRLTYVTALPYANITAKVRNASLTLLLIFAAALLLGIAASLFFSRRIHRPVKQMLSSIVSRDPVRPKSAIREFDLIHQNLHELMQEKEAVQKELLGKKSLLTSFGYINKLKAITSDINDWQDIAEMDDPFRLVLAQLHFKEGTVPESHSRPDRIAYYIREYINVVMTEHLPHSHTFQIDTNQILTLVKGENEPEKLGETLEKLKPILDRDKAYFLVTLAVGSVHQGSGQFNAAYRQAQEMAQQARPLDECQIIRSHRVSPPYALTAAQDQELFRHIQAGNLAHCVSLTERIVEQMEKKDAGFAQYRQIAESILLRAARAVEPYGRAAAASVARPDSGADPRQASPAAEASAHRPAEMPPGGGAGERAAAAGASGHIPRTLPGNMAGHGDSSGGAGPAVSEAACTCGGDPGTPCEAACACGGACGPEGALSFQERHQRRLRTCYTPDQFRRFYAQMFKEAAGIIATGKEERDSVIDFVMNELENKFADNISLDLLADRLNLSAAYLSVYIKEKTGANFSEQLNAIRIRRAKELLGGTGLSVQEISVRIGYRNVTSFNRMFKKMTGLPPGEYRKRQVIGGDFGDL